MNPPRSTTAETRQKNVRLPEHTRRQLEECAAADGMSTTDTLILAIDHYTRLRAAERAAKERAAAERA